jgi:hypothetical protein
MGKRPGHRGLAVGLIAACQIGYVVFLVGMASILYMTAYIH